MAKKALAAFERITLNPGEAKTVTMHIGERELSFWDVTIHDWKKVGGYCPIYVGASSRDIRLTNWYSFFPPVYTGTPNVVKAGSAVPINLRGRLTGKHALRRAAG